MSKEAAEAGRHLRGWSQEQVTKAAKSLIKFVGQQQAASTDLLEDEDQMFHLVVALKKMPLAKRSDKPRRIPIPHPLYSPQQNSICLFVKDKEGEGHKEAKKLLTALDSNGGVAKVVGLSKLKTKFESHEAKRQLCKTYDLFLADDRILPSLPKLIGKSFFKKKKQPIPVRLRGDWGKAVESACQATYLHNKGGTCISVKVARSSFTQEQVAENLHAALAGVVQRIPKKWSNVQAVYIKSTGSVALPLYQTIPDSKMVIKKD